MQYRVDPKTNNKLSALGFGCMRLPKKLNQIDYGKAEKLIVDAVERGVNYFDTAYSYEGSEEVLGRVLSNNNLRNKIYLATKLRLGKCHKYADFDMIFSTQLDRLQTDHIDYYLMHHLPDMKTWERLSNLGIQQWIQKKKESGQIKSVGFSFHGTQEDFLSLLDIYEWDFCQIQYNYLNTHYQAGQAGLSKAAEKGLPVFIMEPLLGGTLATGVPQKALALFRSVDEKLSPAAWALRWLWNQQEVTVVLSGMNEQSQLDENIGLANQAKVGMLTEKELSIYKPVLEVFHSAYKIPCTGCNYCMPCPQNVNIPACFAAYNFSHTIGKFTGLWMYITSTSAANSIDNSRASKCITCGKCERECPQNIKITSAMQDVKKRMEPFWFGAAMKLYSIIR